MKRFTGFETGMWVSMLVLSIFVFIAPVAESQETAASQPKASSVLDTLALPTDFQQTAALYQLLSQADAEDLKRYIKEVDSISDPNDRAAGSSIIYSRFAELDPQAAVDYLLDAGGENIHGALYSVFSSWSKVDLEAAIARSQQLGGFGNKQVAMQAILRAHPNLNPQSLADLASRMGTEGETQIQVLSITKVGELARTDPEAAMAQALQLTPSTIKFNAVTHVGMVWSETDPRQALVYSKQITEPKIQAHFIGTVFYRLSERSPTLALELLNDEVSQQQRQVVLQSVFIPMAGSNPEQAFDLAQKLADDADRKRAYDVIFIVLAENNPSLAFAKLQTLRDAEISDESAHRVLESFAPISPDQSMGWAALQGESSQALMIEVINSVAKKDPEKAILLASELPTTQARNQAISQVLVKIAASDPQLASQLLELVSNGALRQQTARNIAVAWVQTDAESALAWIFTQTPQLQGQLLSGIVYQLANQDVELAKMVLPEIRKGRARQQWVQAIVNKLAASDPGQAVNWMQQFKGQPEFDGMMRILVTVIAETNIPEALSLLATIDSDDNRRSAVHSVVYSWAQKDAEAAAAWVSQSFDGSGREDLLRTVAEHWSQSDFDAAFKWAKQMPNTDDRDLLLSGLFENVFLEADQAKTILSAITSQEIRESSASVYIVTVGQYDLITARNLIPQLQLSAQGREKAMASLDQIELRGW